MLSFKTIIATQLLQLILNSGDKGLTITELKKLTGLQGTAVSRTALLLKKGGWLRINSFYRYRTTEKAKEASLYDLVMTIDDRIQLATHVNIKNWGNNSHITMKKAMVINQELCDSFGTMLKKIKLCDMIQVKRETLSLNSTSKFIKNATS